ncbi:hypothetical protein XENORESO_003544, partial [Xenotaenia resolanae]
SNPTHQDLNTKAAWAQGYTGRGVVVTILDDGIEKDHPDLIANYDPDASYDVNDGDTDPQPRYTQRNENSPAAAAAFHGRVLTALRPHPPRFFTVCVCFLARCDSRFCLSSLW